MSKDKDLDGLDNENVSALVDSEQEENLEWLLDMESYDTEDTLFQVAGDDYQEEGLSDFESQMAERPMIRGNDMGDDLANYVDEEIVISSDSTSSDIYSNSEQAEREAQKSAEEAGRKMAIDFTRSDAPAAKTGAKSVAEGTDILGLASEDDMGETYFTIKRVKSAVAQSSAGTVARAESPTVEQELRAGVAVDSPAVGAVAGSDVRPVDLGGSSGSMEESAPNLDDLEDAPVPTQVALPEDSEVANHAPDETALDGLSLEDAPVDESLAIDQELAEQSGGLFTDENLDEDFALSIEGETSFDSGDRDEVVLFETDIDTLGADEQELAGLSPLEADFDAFDSDEAVAGEDPVAGADPVDSVEALLPAEEPDSLEDLGEVLGEAADLDITAVDASDDINSVPEFDMSDFAAASTAQTDATNVEDSSLELPDAEFDASAPPALQAQGSDGLTETPVEEVHADTAAVLADELTEALDPKGDIEFSSEFDDELDAELDEGRDYFGLDAVSASDLEKEIDVALEGFDFESVSEDGLDASIDQELENLNLDTGVDSALEEELEDFAAEFSTEADLETDAAATAEQDTEVDLQLGVDEPLAADFEAVDTTDSMAVSALTEATAVANTTDVSGAEQGDAEDSEQELSAGFDEDIFAADLGADVDDPLDGALLESDADIDSAFLGLSGPLAEDDTAFDAPLDELVAQADSIDGLAQETVEAQDDAVDMSASGDGTGTSQSDDPTVPAMVEPAPASAIDLAALDTSSENWAAPAGVNFTESSGKGGDIFADFLDAFVEEGSAEIEKLEDLVSEWEKDVVNAEIAAEIGRILHTVKGIAKGVGLQRYGTLIHNFETLLEALPDPDGDTEQQNFFRLINVWLDAVVRGIESIGESRGDIASELPVVVVEKTARKSSTGSKTTSKARSTAKDRKADKKEAAKTPEEKAARSKSDQQLADEGAKALGAQQSVRITSETLDHWLNLASQTQQLCVRASQTNNRGKRSTAELQGRLSSVRTHIGKIADRALLSVNARGNSNQELDALEMDQYSELQEAASILREGVEDLGDLIDLLGRQNNQVEALLKQQSSVISSISSSLQGSRVVPVSRLMPGLRRLVRTVSTDLGKVVTFRVLNEVGALDRDHHARLQVVLEHMVRNALDHGIESPDERLAAGKPNAGRITVDVVKSGGDYVIKLADDGRGIDADAIRESARKKVLDVDVDALDDDQAMRLIFHKGFSTSDTVSEISGRGVGMDIVLSELQQLGGDIQIQSAPGQGTTFVVRIPSNVTVNGALMVSAGDDAYAIPLNGLIAVEQVPAEEFFSAVRQKNTLQLFDMECEPAYLATLCQGVALPERNFWEAFVPVIIAGSEERHMAIAIDNVEEALELVVRSLGSQFSTVPGLAGAATTADGEAIVALDLNLLVESVGADGIAPISDTKKETHQALLALVVDDSRTQRMVATSQLDTVGVETVTAENGQVAIDLLNATHRLPDVVLLDVEMPVKDGIETLREIRKSQRYGHLPVIMVTSRTGAKHRALAKSAGCNAYMGKPFNFPALVEQINVLTRHNLQLS